MRRRCRCEPLDDYFQPLAAYNSEVARGIVHTAEWGERMAKLQAEFNDWMLTGHRPPGMGLPVGTWS